MDLHVKHLENPLSVYRRACECLADYCMANQIEAIITGLSGGVDSAVVYGIGDGASRIVAMKGKQFRNIGVMLPLYSSDESKKNAREVFEVFGGELIDNIDLIPAFHSLRDNCGLPRGGDLKVRVSLGNMKARLRMISLYHIAGLNNGMVMSTDNYSEYLMGFWTLHGDVGDYGPCQMLWKSTEMYDIAKAIGVPQSVIDAVPTDDLGVKEGGDEAQLGAPYSVVDNIMNEIIYRGLDPDGGLGQMAFIDKYYTSGEYPMELVESLAMRCLKAAFKRNGCINLRRRADLGLHQDAVQTA